MYISHLGDTLSFQERSNIKGSLLQHMYPRGARPYLFGAGMVTWAWNQASYLVDIKVDDDRVEGRVKVI